MITLPPMLASSTWPDALAPSEWVAEQKIDGHRVLARIDEEGRVSAWSRLLNVRTLPAHLTVELQRLPPGVYDGELFVPGLTATDTKALAQEERLHYVLFDHLQDTVGSLIDSPFSTRSALLSDAFRLAEDLRYVKRIAQLPVSSVDEIYDLARAAWHRGEEGLVVKRWSGVYRPGKRSRDWFKLKKTETAVLTITGFGDGRWGRCSIVELRSDDGATTTVKVLNFDELARIQAAPESYIGRRLRIDFQERSRAGAFRHPHWDRLEEEGEE